jgi:hypothetical protein
VGRSGPTDRLKIAQNGDPWVGRSDTQITLSTSRRLIRVRTYRRTTVSRPPPVGWAADCDGTLGERTAPRDRHRPRAHTYEHGLESQMKSPAPRPTPPAATTHLRRAHISGSAPAPCRRIREATHPDTDETDVHNCDCSHRHRLSAMAGETVQNESCDIRSGAMLERH